MARQGLRLRRHAWMRRSHDPDCDRNARPVDTVTSVKGSDHTITAWFEPDPATRTIAWGSARTEDYKGAVRAFLAKQKPTFTGKR